MQLLLKLLLLKGLRLPWLHLQWEDQFRKRHKLGCSQQTPDSVIPEAERIALGMGEEGRDCGLEVDPCKDRG